ncbi:unnamed protein product, partial [Iphiclides podalirius]
MNTITTGFKNGAITLDDPEAIYYSGQIISGKIEFVLSEALSFSAINVVYNGEANVSWTERQTEIYSGVKRYINVEYKGYEEYFTCVQCICGNHGMSVLPAGTHSIPFSYRIPYTAPSSFNSSIGRVSYKVTAYLECPPTREELVKTFEVVAPLDLNKDPTGEVNRPIAMEFEELYSCCCSSQPITIRVEVPVSGFCPGQAMPITVRAKNDSATEISRIYFQLVMKERYHSRSPVSEYVLPERILATAKKGPVLGNTKREYQCELRVPEILAPNLAGCGIIDLGYFFKVIVKLSGCSDDLQDECEIQIGLIPLDITTGGGAYVHPLRHRLPRELPPPAPAPAPAPAPPPTPPPSDFPPQGHISASAAPPRASPLPQPPPPGALRPLPRSIPRYRRSRALRHRF